jgi:hypothetical protein
VIATYEPALTRTANGNRVLEFAFSALRGLATAKAKRAHVAAHRDRVLLHQVEDDVPGVVADDAFGEHLEADVRRTPRIAALRSPAMSS